MLISQMEIQIYKKFELKPTEEQKKLIFSISKYILNGQTNSTFVLNGYAGTGKTSIMSALIKVLSDAEIKMELLAPTGRAAKVMQYYSGANTHTIHRKIYLKNSAAVPHYALNYKTVDDTVFIVDEVSMIAERSHENNIFGSGNLLGDLIEYVFAGNRNKLILVGDSAQLPPVGMLESPALSPVTVGYYTNPSFSQLKEVVRQAHDSLILKNATAIRKIIESDHAVMPVVEVGEDVEQVVGADLIEKLEIAYHNAGKDNTVIVTRSNKRALHFNKGIRQQIFDMEDEIEAGDRLMVVKNNYFDIKKDDPFEFIANGDIIVVERISKIIERYGFRFGYMTYTMPDYANLEREGWVLLSTLYSEAPSLTSYEQNQLYENVMMDYASILENKRRARMVMNNEFFNALQVKFAYAITCHKAQGGQWEHVFVDTPVFGDEELSLELTRWIYTAVTRATKKLYLVGWKKDFFPYNED